jgi:hypothetical protein
MRQALVPYLRPAYSRKQKCKHRRSKAKGGVEGGVGRLNATGEGQHGERTTLQQLCNRRSKQRRALVDFPGVHTRRFSCSGIFSNSEISSHVNKEPSL